MISLRLSFVLMFAIFFNSSQSWSFDRLNCDSTLGKWLVYNSERYEKEVLSKNHSSTILDRDNSIGLWLRDEKGNEIASVLPWNGISMLKSRQAEKMKYQFKFKSDNETWFDLEVTDSKTHMLHQFSCRLTF